MARSTSRLGAETELGGFGGFFDPKAAGFKDPLLVAATDGVGTKLRIAIDCGIFDTVGVDLVAMCVNDLIVQGAEPLFFLDYFATGKLKIAEAADVVSGIAEGCRQAGCALIGGETAEMPGMYAAGDFDLAGFTVGAVERDRVLTGEAVRVGDVIVGLASSGIHSNGFSLVRRIIELQKLSYQDIAPFDASASLGAALLTPTRIYVKSCLQAVRAGHVHAMAHITGGGLLENIPRILPDGLAAEIDSSALPRLPVFDWLSKAGGVSSAEMFRTFNCGVGMAVIVPEDTAGDVEALFVNAGETAHRIGRIIVGDDSPAVKMLGDG